MMIAVDPNSPVPVYRQLMDQIKFQVASGILVPGEELPSTRGLSNQLGVNPMTISKAYSYLERDGVVERRPGRPLVVRAFEEAGIRQHKTDHLRQSLAPAVSAARQLGIDTEEAVDVFRRLLSDGAIAPVHGPEEEEE